MAWSPAAWRGSSPHARGARLRAVVAQLFQGIIPACAGSTACARAMRRLTRDHPRMRGEHSLRARMRLSSGGSSPHARGALNSLAYRNAPHGIIPACAGSTGSQRRVRACAGDHPRMRGEHKDSSSPSTPSAGSSPHARGARPQNLTCACEDGIIPACAGSTLMATYVAAFSGDHPRMRGEHWRCGLGNGYFSGSSPHARGAQVPHHQDTTRGGIIPACAGSTRTATHPGHTGRDHPRMRGEHRTCNARPNGL